MMAGVIVLAPAAPAWATTRCKDEGGTTKAQNRQVRVYSYRDGDQRQFAACLKRTGRVRFLGKAGFRNGLGRIVLRGRYVKWEDFSNSYGDVTLDVSVLDVARGRYTGWSFTSMSPPMYDVRPLQILGERLKPNGSYAFAVGGFDDPWPARTYAVYRRDSRGRKRLDKSPDIDPDSFRATRTRLRWVRGGVVRTALFA
jgi:hypothetical protein